jgi:hypothetical protein
VHALPSRVFSSEKNELEIVRKKPLVLKSGFILLAEHENQELVLGRVPQFWKLISDSIPRIYNTQEFLAFTNPSYAKAAMNFKCTVTTQMMRWSNLALKPASRFQTK